MRTRPAENVLGSNVLILNNLNGMVANDHPWSLSFFGHRCEGLVSALPIHVLPGLFPKDLAAAGSEEWCWAGVL